MFSREEWIDLILRSIGLNPSVYSDHQKMLLLCRLVPLVEPNSNIMELGPKATGKTYLYRNISYYTRVISGGKVSPATLFYNISTKSVGEIGVRDCVVLDEISKLTFSNGEEMIGKLKDYMVDGFFERGPKKAHAACSLVFMGNMEFGTSMPEPSDAMSFLPTFMHDSAIIDRIHAFIPGWELPKIRQSSEHLAKGYGIVADYLSEVFHQLSLQSYTSIVSERVKLHGDVTIRDEKAIKKTASGILKLLCPDRQCEDSDIAVSMDLAVRARQRITALLHSISPAEFVSKTFSYSVM
jgi:ATP-dependent Lon protease